MANPMELSEEIQSSGSRKRKADDGGSPLESSDHLEDDGVVDMVGYDEKQGGDPEESDVSSREEGQEWDVDSFDDGFDYRPKRNLDPNDELGQKMHRYRSQMYRSKGFDVDRENIPGNVAYRPLGPIDLDKPFKRTGLTGREFMHNMVALALERYNRIKGSTVTCEHIVRAIVALVSGVKSYITFMAREVPDGDLVEYQAKTEQRVWQRKPHVIFCRPAPKPKDPTDDDFVYTDSSSDVEDSDESSRGSGQEWDVDSLDDKPEYKLPRVNIPSDDEVEKMRLYRPKMYKSKGFNVDGECYSGRMLYFSPVDLDENLCPYKITGREYMQNMVDLALESYNKIKGSTVTCEYIVRANLTKVGGFKSYITFMAREVPGGDLVEYQAKTEKKFSQKKAHAIFCRPSPKPKEDMAIDSRIVLTELELLKKSLDTLPLDIEESSSSC